MAVEAGPPPRHRCRRHRRVSPHRPAQQKGPPRPRRQGGGLPLRVCLGFPIKSLVVTPTQDVRPRAGAAGDRGCRATRPSRAEGPQDRGHTLWPGLLTATHAAPRTRSTREAGHARGSFLPVAQGKDGTHGFNPVAPAWFCFFVFQISKATVCW